MTKYQKSIAKKILKDTKRMTWEQICERMAIELCIVTMKMKEKK